MADLILQRINQQGQQILQQYNNSKECIGYFVVDDLLPEETATSIYQAFPQAQQMQKRKSLREYKYIAAQMDQHNPLLEEAIYAFQDPRVVEAVSQICAIESLYPDEHLYAGGISLMQKGQFLNPHLDNSHEKNRDRWRVLNLLYYVSPDWTLGHGGNLELWPQGLKQPQNTIESRFNRLVVMATHGTSWHSVSPVVANANRSCVSNYYFSDSALNESDRFHITSFRGRPDQKVRDILLQGDRWLRQGIRKVFPKGVVKTRHVYQKPGDE